LQAEKEAAKLVQQARQYRTQRLKDARTDATKEVEEYKRQKEQEFKAFEAKHSSSSTNSQSQIDADINAKLKSIEQSFRSNEEAVVKKILDRVVKVEAQLHRNLKKE